MTTPLVQAIARALAERLEEFDIHGLPQAALTAITEAGYAVVPIVPTPEMVAETVQQVGDPSPEAWALAERVCAGLGVVNMQGEVACAELIRDWAGMIRGATNTGKGGE